MKKTMISEAVGMIDDRYITEAAEFTPQKKSVTVHRNLGFAVAACLVIAAFSVFAVMRGSRLKPSSSQEANDIQPRQGAVLPGPYNPQLSPYETAIVWPWNYKTELEKYSHAFLDGAEYYGVCSQPNMSALISDASLIGKSLGKCQILCDYEYQERSEYQEFDAYEINGADPEFIIAVKLDSGYALYRLNTDLTDMTLENVVNKLGIADKMEFTYTNGEVSPNKYGDIKISGGKELFAMLLDNERSRKALISNPKNTSGRGIALYAACPAYGTGNTFFQLNEDGTVSADLLGFTAVFDIGRDNAQRMIAYVKEHSEPASSTSLYNQIGGRVTEIGKGYIRINDTELCKDPADGRVYTVPTDDIRIKRCIEFSNQTRVGDIVAVSICGSIDPDGTVHGAYDLVGATITDGGVEVAE